MIAIDTQWRGQCHHYLLFFYFVINWGNIDIANLQRFRFVSISSTKRKNLLIQYYGLHLIIVGFSKNVGCMLNQYLSIVVSWTILKLFFIHLLSTVITYYIVAVCIYAISWNIYNLVFVYLSYVIVFIHHAHSCCFLFRLLIAIDFQVCIRPQTTFACPTLVLFIKFLFCILCYSGTLLYWHE